MKQIRRKLFALNLVPLLLIGMLAMPVHAETATASGYCGGEGDGTNLTWALSEDGILTISGKGEMANWAYDITAPWSSFRSNIKSAIILDGVTTIGSYAFCDCYALSGITISNSVTSIGEWAFSNCYTLAEVTIPNSVTFIGNNAFNWCLALSEIAIPGSVTYIGDQAFSCCKSLTAIHVNANNPDYSSDGFGVLFNKNKTTLIQAPCAIAGTYTIPGTVASINDGAFQNCRMLTKVTIPNSVISIGDRAFAYCYTLTEVTISDGLQLIGDYAFCDCYALTEATIPNSVISIGDFAFFQNFALAEVIIPNSVTYIGDQAFACCKSLTAIHVNTGNPNYSSDSFGVLFNKDKTVLIQAPGTITGAYSIPDSVTSISSQALANCAALAKVTIPGSVTSVSTQVFASHSDLELIHFKGDAPALSNNVFLNVTATAYYPDDNATWTQEIMQDYGGNITWAPSNSVVIRCDACTETNTAITVLYGPEAAESITCYLALYDKEDCFLRLETVTKQSNADGSFTLSISYTEEEYDKIGRIAAFVVDGQTMQPLCKGWDTPVNIAIS